MSLLKEIAAELFSMFMADARLSGSILALVLAVAVLNLGLGVNPMFGGALLSLGCLGILAEATARETGKRRGS
ncbi:MAG: hypothetical protein O2944_08820 [Proteobacteria bacterium]|nr:hypothetical protein [Pseudomonadota bacterium]